MTNLEKLTIPELRSLESEKKEEMRSAKGNYDRYLLVTEIRRIKDRIKELKVWKRSENY